jgi:hypothetical protein
MAEQTPDQVGPEPVVDLNKTYVEIWSKAVDTQMHFNEMSVKSRQLGLTFVAAALGVSVVLLSRHDDFSLMINICGMSIPLHISVLIILAAAGAIWGVKILDSAYITGCFAARSPLARISSKTI